MPDRLAPLAPVPVGVSATPPSRVPRVGSSRRRRADTRVGNSCSLPPAPRLPPLGAPPCRSCRPDAAGHRRAGVADRVATPTGLQGLPTGSRRSPPAGVADRVPPRTDPKESWVASAPASAARRGRVQSGPDQGVGNSCSVVEAGAGRGRAGLHAGAADGVPPPRGSEESRRRTACTVTDARHQRGHTRLACRQLLPRGVQVRQRGRSAARSRSCRPAQERTRGRHASSERS